MSVLDSSSGRDIDRSRPYRRSWCMRRNASVVPVSKSGTSPGLTLPTARLVFPAGAQLDIVVHFVQVNFDRRPKTQFSPKKSQHPISHIASHLRIRWKKQKISRPGKLAERTSMLQLRPTKTVPRVPRTRQCFHQRNHSAMGPWGGPLCC